MRSRALAITLAGSLPLLALVIWPLARALPDFFDPCFFWGQQQAEMTAVLEADGPCRAIRGTSQTKTQAVVNLVLVQGGILAAVLLALAGAVLARPVLTVLGAGLIFLESIPLIFSFAFLTVFASGIFLLAARQMVSFGRVSRTGARVIGALALAALPLYLPSIFSGALFLVFLVAALAFVAAVGWWPAA